jgi:3-oxoacyl-[acyl-carrier-protein] synthase II
MSARIVGAALMVGEPVLAVPRTAFSGALGEAMARAERRDRASALALCVVERLLASVALTEGERDRCALVHGTALGCAVTNDAYHRKLVTNGPSKSLAGLFGYTVPSAPIGEVSIAFGFRDHQSVLMAGRCSGIAALAEARRILALGRAPRVLVLAGDILGPDRLPWTGQAPAEAMVALLVERDDGKTGAFLTRAGIERRPGGPPGGLNYLGASGIVELARWFEGDATSFDTDVIDGSGVVGNLAVERR